VWFVLGGKGGLGEIGCLSKRKQLAIAELAPNKSKLLPKNKPHRTEPFLLNLKKDNAIYIVFAFLIEPLFCTDKITKILKKVKFKFPFRD